MEKKSNWLDKKVEYKTTRPKEGKSDEAKKKFSSSDNTKNTKDKLKDNFSKKR